MDQSTRFSELLSQANQGLLSRRTVLKRAAALGLSAPAIAALLAACGGGDQPDTGTGGGGQGTEGTDGSESSPTSGGQASGQRGGGGTIRLLYWQAPTILNPHLSAGTKDFHAGRISLEPLADFKEDGSMQLVLAAEEPSLDNGQLAEDGKSVTWKLKQNVKWHDGTPFTAKDVKFTYEWVSNEATAATTYGSYETIESVEVVDDHTVTIRFTQPEPAWSKPFTGENGLIIPEHIMKDYVGESARNAEFNLKPIGTGPYKVVDFRPGDMVVYEINQDYWDEGKPFFDTVELKGGGDATSAARAVLQTGEADWAWNIQVEDAVLTQLEQSGQGTVVAWAGGGTEKMLINHSDPQTEQDGQRSHKDVPHPHFQELKVRQALAFAVDREAIASRLYGRGGEPTASTINIAKQFIPDDISWEYNLEKAAGLLDEVGATPGPDGIRVFNNRPMHWLYQTSINPIRQKHQEIVKRSLGEIGILVEIKAIDASVYFSGDPGNADTTGHFYADIEMYTNSPSNIFPIDWYRRYLSTDIAQKENQWANENYLRYQNPEFDELFNQVKQELDPDKANELFRQMQRLVWEDVAEIGAVARQNVSCVATKVTGYETSPWRPEVADIANWRTSE